MSFTFDIGKSLKDFKLKGSIKGRLVLYFLLLVLVPFALLGLMAYQSEKAALRERIRGHLTSIADIQKGRMMSWLDERVSDARFLSQHREVAANLAVLKKINDPQKFVKTAAYMNTMDIVMPIRRAHNYLEVMILDEKGRIMLCSEGGDIGKYRSDEPYFISGIAQKPGESHIQDIYLDPHVNKIVMAFSAPVPDAARPDRTGGLVVTIVGMDESFYPIFDGWPGMGKTGDTIISRIEGNRLVFLNRLRYYQDAPLKLSFAIDKENPLPAYLGASGKEGIIETTDYRGVEVLAAYRHIPQTGWGFVVKEDYDDAFASVHKLTKRVAFTMGLTLMMVFFLVHLVSNKIAQPIISLNSLARRVAGGDFSVRIPVTREDEVGSLARTFNDMASALMEYRSQVDEKNAELESANRELVALAQSLEEKVKGRTQELEDMNRALFSMMDDLDERTAALEKSQQEMKKFADELEDSRNRVKENLDIVERANVELRRIDRMKDHFLGMMSHELRTPLSLITGYSSNLIQDAGLDLEPKVAEAVEGISKGAERLKNIVSEMLDVSQIDAKGLRLTFTPANIGALVEEVLRELNTFIKERKQLVVLERYENLPEVLIDKRRMHQVLVNILGNAIKFTPDGGVIEVSFRMFDENCEVVPATGDPQPGSYLDISIKDSGIGLDPDELDRIFEKFYEVGEIDKHSTSKFAFLGRGVGLGLPIARGIVEAHGGRLWAESPGHDPKKCPGSYFHIALPVNVEIREKTLMGVVAETVEKAAGAEPAPKAEEPALAAAVQPDAKCLKVLVIEDDPDILNLTRMVLGERYLILTATGGVEGIKAARGEMPNLILLDVYMEDLNGYEVCEILKKDEQTRHIPIALFTAGVQRWEVEKGLKSGADDYITKPFKPTELLAKVNSIISGSCEAARG